MTDREQLIDLLAKRSVKTGHFTLASGASSTIYVDVRTTSMSPEGLSLIGRLGLTQIRQAGWKADAVGGTTLGADPIAYAISYTSYFTPPLVRAFTVRKEEKKHGGTKLIEGPFNTTDHVVVVEDVITTGHSALHAIEAVQGAGATISGILAIVDRESGGSELLRAKGYPVISLTYLSEITPSIAG
jgi:orotate phosphoribosyltransferase